MKYLFLILFSVSAFGAQEGFKISGYPNKPRLIATDLFITAAPGVTNNNISYAQLEQQLETNIINSATATNKIINIITNYDDNINLKNYNTFPLGNGDSTIGVQAAFNDAQNYFSFYNPTREAGRMVFIPKGTYILTDTIVITNVYQMLVVGESGASTFLWRGATNVPAFKFINAHTCTFRDFSVAVEPPYHLQSGFLQYSDTGFGNHFFAEGTQNTYQNVNVQSTSGQLDVGWRIGSDVNGLFGVALGTDAGNDFTTFDRCRVRQCALAAFDLEGANCFDNIFKQCIVYGETNTIGVYSYAANFRWEAGYMAYSSPLFKTESSSPSSYVVDGINSELGAKFLDTGIASGGKQRWEIKNCRFSPDLVSPSTREIFTLTKAGVVNIHDNLFGTISTSNNMTINYFSHFIPDSSLVYCNNTLYTATNNIFTQFQPNIAYNNNIVSNGVYLMLPERRVAAGSYIYGNQNISGGLVVTNLPAPSALNINYFGGGGSTTWGYKATAITDFGESLPTAIEWIATGANTLDSTHYVQITILGGYNVPGAKGYRIYRTTAGISPNTTGLIGTIYGEQYGGLMTLVDNGLPATGSIPTVDTSGNVFVFGNQTNSATFSSLTNSSQVIIGQNVDGTGQAINAIGGVYARGNNTYLRSLITHVGGQFAADNGTFFMDTNGNAFFAYPTGFVGIGVLSPLFAKLEIRNTNNAQLNLSRNDTNYILFNLNDAGNLSITPAVGTNILVPNISASGGYLSSVLNLGYASPNQLLYTASGGNVTSLPTGLGITNNSGILSNNIIAGGGVTIAKGANGQLTISSSSTNGGTVSSVALTAPAIFTITGSPVTTNGTLGINYSGTALPIANGGTAGTTAAAARTALGLDTGLGITNNGSILSNNIVAGANMSITKGANGQLTLASTGGFVNPTGDGVVTVTGGVINPAASFIQPDLNGNPGSGGFLQNLLPNLGTAFYVNESGGIRGSGAGTYIGYDAAFPNEFVLEQEDTAGGFRFTSASYGGAGIVSFDKNGDASFVHIGGIMSGTPTILKGAGLGAGPSSATLDANANDTSMTVTLVVGTTPLASNTLFTLTFAKPYLQAPHIVWSPSNNTAALKSNLLGFPSAITTTQFTFVSTSANTTTGDTYVLTFHVIK